MHQALDATGCTPRPANSTPRSRFRLQTHWGPAVSDNVLDHIAALRSFSRVLCRGRDEAEDLVQETLLRAIEYSASYKAGTNMRGWLFTIMRNCFYTNLKKRRHEHTGADQCASGSVSTPATQEWHMQGCELSQALQQLPLSYREAVVVVLVIGESYADAAHLLQCEIGTIKSRVNRGRAMLKKKLEDLPDMSAKPRRKRRPVSLCRDFSTGFPVAVQGA